HRARRGSAPPQPRPARNIAAKGRASALLHTAFPYSTVWELGRALAPVNTVVYGELSQGMSHGRSTYGKRLARPGPQDPCQERLYGAEGGAARENDGGVAGQLLLAFRRYRRVPRRDPEALARGRGRSDHCRSRASLRQPAAAVAPPGVQRQTG